MPRRRTGARSAWRFWMMAALPAALACQGDQLTRAPLAAPEDLYWELRLNHHAVILSTTAPYDTLTLAATPYNQLGAALADLPAPQYRSLNIDQVLVTPAGVLIARAPTSTDGVVDFLVPVIATLTDGNLKHEDTVVVKVVADPAPPRLATFSIHPIPPDSAKTGVNLFGGAGTAGPRNLVPQIVDSNGGVMTGIPVAYRSSDPTVADVLGLSVDPRVTQYFYYGFSPATITGYRPGMVTFYASTTAFGIAKADTLLYRVGYPIRQLVSVSAHVSQLGDTTYFVNPSVATIGVGGMIVFGGKSDIVFDEAQIAHVAAGNTYSEFLNPFATEYPGFDPYTWDCLFWGSEADCDGAGNVTLGSGFVRAQRVFQAPGTYEYQVPARGLSGRIVVVDES